MKRKTARYLVIIIILLMTGSFFNKQISLAASAEVEIKADSSEIIVGEEFYVYVNFSSDTMFGDIEANLVYNDEILEYVGGASVIKGGSGYLRISDMNVSDTGTARKYVLKFQALKVGSSDISFDGAIMVYDEESGSDMSVSSNTLSINVKATQTASSNAYLKSLKVSPSAIEPAFNKNISVYNTSVGYDTEKLIVEAIAEDEKAVVNIKGNDSLKEGENKVIVTVIAESGANIEYTINVNREAAPVEEEKPDNETTPPTKHGTFTVTTVDGGLYAVYGGKYKLIEPDIRVEIPAGYTKDRIIISGIDVNVYVSGNMDDEFYLIYAENELGEKGFYQYDRIERTLQRFTGKKAPGSSVSVDNSEASEFGDDYRDSLRKAVVVIAILSGLCAILMIITIRTYMKSRGYRDDDFE